MPTPTRFSSALLSGAFLLCPALLSAGTTIHVSTVHDELGGGGCSLRAAVIAANTDTTIDSCPAGSGADTIVLPAGTFGLSLAGPNEDYARTGDLDIRGTVTIQGAGADQTVIAGNHLVDEWDYEQNDRVLHVSAHGRLTLAGVTVSGGRCYSGGGIMNSGRLVVVESEIRDNRTSGWWNCNGGGFGGAGVYNRGEVEISRSRLLNNVDGFGGYDTDAPGGALNNVGRATVDTSVIAANYAAAGGGIFNEGGLRVVGSRLTGNGARFVGSAIDNDRGTLILSRSTVDANVGLGALVNGYGVYGAPSRLLIENSTVSDNIGYRLAAVTHFSGDAKVVGATIAGNSTEPGSSAGVAGVVHLTNTVVAGNVGGPNCDAYAVSHGYNADSDNSCNLGTAGDQPNVDPRLGPLADNGGPTPTRALLEDSPLLDRIPAGLCRFSTDQRGVARPAGGACDIGAFERGPGDLFAPDRNDD